MNRKTFADFSKLPLASPLAKEQGSHRQAVEDWLAGKGPRPAQQTDAIRALQMAFHGTAKRLVSLRLDEWIIALTKEVARQHDLRYQGVLRQWIIQGLRRAIDEGEKK